MASLVTAAANIARANPMKFSWQQTMLRIKDPKITVPFYQRHFGFTLLHSYDFPQWNFSLYFLAILPEHVSAPSPGTKESEEFLWNFNGTCLELTHNHGTETDPSFRVNNGNVEPHRGFGHIAVMTKDVYATSAELEENGVKFQKRPNEGMMKGLAFALDPDGYWVEIVRRNEESRVSNKFTLAQTMIRVKDPVPSLKFYTEVLGMTLLNEIHNGVGTSWGFSLYFLAHLSPEEKSQFDGTNGGDLTRNIFSPVLELTHNHGTESRPEFHYHNGNDNSEEEKQGRGYGHIGYLVDDLEETCKYLDAAGVRFKKRPEEGNMRSIAFVFDPDNYWVEIIQRDGFRLTRDSTN
jgi:lactoylglutathione lyase